MSGKKSIVRQFEFTTQYSPKSTQTSSSEKNKCYSDPYDSLTDPHYGEALKALTSVNSNAQDLGNEITALINKNLALKEKLKLLAIEKDTLVIQNDFIKESLNKEIALLKQQADKAKQKSKEKKNSLRKQKQEFEEILQKEKEESKKSIKEYKTKLKSMKLSFKNILSEKEKQAKQLLGLLSQTKKYSKQVKELLEGSETNICPCSLTDLKPSKPISHCKSKSYAVCSPNYKTFSQTIPESHEKDHEEVSQYSFESYSNLSGKKQKSRTRVSIKGE